MWRLLKAEIRDTKFFLVALFFFMEFNFFLVAYLERQQATINASVPQTITVVVFLYFFMKRHTEMRTRFHQPLPLSITQLGAARIFYPVLFWLGILVLYALSYLRYPILNHPGYLWWRLLAFNNLMIGANAAFLISFDIGNGFPKMTPIIKTLFLTFLWIYVLGSGIAYWEHPVWEMMRQEPLPSLLDFLYFSITGSIFLHLVSVGLCSLSVVIFKKRLVYFV